MLLCDCSFHVTIVTMANYQILLATGVGRYKEYEPVNAPLYRVSQHNGVATSSSVFLLFEHHLYFLKESSPQQYVFQCTTCAAKGHVWRNSPTTFVA